MIHRRRVRPRSTEHPLATRFAVGVTVYVGAVLVNICKHGCYCVPWYVIPATYCGEIATDGFAGGLVAWSQEFTLITEQTLRAAASCQGVGLHSGAPVNLQILPAPASTGIIFRRVDLDGFEIEAVGKNVARVSYATSLMKKGVLISTTEHLLSAFVGMGIDNAIVQLDNLELPILDGSARPFIDLIKKAGVRKQRRPRTYIRILRPLEFREGNKFIGVYPAETYSVSYTINFPHPLIGRETFTLELTNGQYVSKIASARTFGFLHEAEAMRQQGLIRGASSENVLVLTQDGLVNPPLRYDDEFVRHKILDLIGDLALIGRRVLGKVVADRAGHAMHTALVSRLLRDRTLWEETTLAEEPIENYTHHEMRTAMQGIN